MTDFKEYDFIIDYKKWGKDEINKLITIAEEQSLTLQESTSQFSPSFKTWSESKAKLVTTRMKFKTIEYHADGISIEISVRKSLYDRKVRVGIWNETGLQYWQALIDKNLFIGGPIEKTIRRLSHRELLEGIRPLAKTRVLTKNDGPRIPSQEAGTEQPLQPWEKIPWDEISDNEWGREALRLFCKGLTYLEIANRLGGGGTPQADTIMNFISRLRRDYKQAGIPNRKKHKKGESVTKHEAV